MYNLLNGQVRVFILFFIMSSFCDPKKKVAYFGFRTAAGWLITGCEGINKL